MKSNGIESIALGECVWRRSVLCFAKSSTAIDEEIEFRISGTRGQHREIGSVANVVPVLLLAKVARRWCLYVTVPMPAELLSCFLIPVLI